MASTSTEKIETHQPGGEHRLRCPDCGYSSDHLSHAQAASLQTSRPCPNCNRMVAVSNGGGHR